MPRTSDLPPEQRLTARTVTLTTDATKKEYTEYCYSIGSDPCSRLRQFIDAELAEARAGKRKA